MKSINIRRLQLTVKSILIMTFIFPSSQIEAHMKRPDGAYRRVLLKLRWGSLVVQTSRDEKQVLALQNSKVQQDITNRRKLVLRFRSPPNTRLSLLFRTLAQQKEWTRLFAKCAMWSIDEYYTLGDELGRGAYGVVWRGKSNITQQDVAIKCMASSDMVGSREVDIMASINHPNVVGVVDVLQTQYTTYLVLELMQGNISEKVIDVKKRDENLVRQIMRQILAGLEELHDNDVIHRDLKPENVLCSFDANDNIQCKITDLGLSTQLTLGQEFVTNQDYYGTPNYSSPEMLEELPYGTKSDIFSVGCIFYELLTGYVAFDGEDSSELQECAEWDDFKHSSVAELVNMMLRKDSEQRISATEALEHRWFKNQ